MKITRQRVLLFVLGVLAAVFVYHSRVAWMPRPGRVPRVYLDSEVAAAWEGASAPAEIVDIRVSPSDALLVLADVNDDGVIDDSDCALRAAGLGELIRLDDTVCNGREVMGDRSPRWDDDLQLLALQLPQAAPSGGILRVETSLTPGIELAFYSSDLLDEAARIDWPLDVAACPFRQADTRRAFVWMKAAAPGNSRSDSFDLTFVLNAADGSEFARDTLRCTLVGGLGDPHYFAGALDYLMERGRLSGKRPRLFLDRMRAEAGPGDFESFQIVVLRHAVTEMTVLETYYDNAGPISHLRTIFDVVRRHDDQTLIVNGNHFVLPAAISRHGNSALGAVVHDHTVSPATPYHRWFKAFAETNTPGEPDWLYQVYALAQPEPGPGRIALLEETYRDWGDTAIERRTPFIPMTGSSDTERPAYMALGGLQTCHYFTHSRGGNKSCLGITSVARPDGGPEEKLIWLAMSDPDPAESTSHYGGDMLRDALRGSGIVIGSGETRLGKPPGPCEMAYLDGGASVAMAYRLDGAFEIPIAESRHTAPSATAANNYLMLRVAGRASASYSGAPEEP